MIKYLTGPVIGMIIGYCTNYIAVKMLFRPRTEKHIFGVRVPLTPGAIPKGKPRLAKAAGDVVATYLVTEQDIGERLLSEATERAVVEKVMEALSWDLGEDLGKVTGGGTRTDEVITRIDGLVTQKILETLLGMDLKKLIGEEGKRIVLERVKGSVFAMFLNERTIDQLIGNVGDEVEQTLKTRGGDLIRPHVERKLSEIRGESALDLLSKAGIDSPKVRSVVTEAYRGAVQTGITKMIREIDIAGMIEEKINAMSAEELERLVISVMKKELNTIINLGALIGFILGMLNIFVK